MWPRSNAGKYEDAGGHLHCLRTPPKSLPGGKMLGNIILSLLPRFHDVLGINCLVLPLRLGIGFCLFLRSFFARSFW